MSTWWSPRWKPGSPKDPDHGWAAGHDLDTPESWHGSPAAGSLDEAAILEPLEAKFGPQVRSRQRVRDLAEVFTHQREVDAMLDLIPDAFTALDIRFLEPTAGGGNFTTEVLRRKLNLVTARECGSQEQYEHQLLRAAASIYGVDISHENVTEARSRMAHVLLEHFQTDAPTVDPSHGFLTASALIIGENITQGDTLNAAEAIELCDWNPSAGGYFRRVWSHALVPVTDRDIFWNERTQDPDPVHYMDLAAELPTRVADALTSRDASATSTGRATRPRQTTR